MNTITSHRYPDLLWTLALGLSAALALPAHAQGVAPGSADVAVISPTGPIIPPNHVRDAAGNPPTSDDTLLWRFCSPATANCPAGFSYPLYSTNGAQLSWGQWSAITGTVRTKCTRAGTHVTVGVRGAMPKALYTVWMAFLGLGPATPAGNPDGTNNVFMTSTSGDGQLSFFRPGIAGDPKWPACVLTSPYEVHLVLAYHMDGLAHGPGPGDPSTQAFHASGVIKQPSP